MKSPAWSMEPAPNVPDALLVATAKLDTFPRKVVERDTGEASIVFERVWSNTSSSSFQLGWFPTLDDAVSYAIELFETLSREELDMNLLKNSKLFPNIRGVMLKEPQTLIMSGKVHITDTRDGDARVEICFTTTDKTAIINRNQALNIIDVYGPETDAWKDMPVVLYGEEGTWFGKHAWGIRVDLDATRRASRAPKKNGDAPKQSELLTEATA